MLYPSVLHAAVHAARTIHAAGLWPMDNDHDRDDDHVRRLVIAVPTLIAVLVWPMLLARRPLHQVFRPQIARKYLPCYGNVAVAWQTKLARMAAHSADHDARFNELWQMLPLAIRRRVERETAREDERLRVADNLHHARHEAGISQAELGDRVEHDDSAISKWESGRRALEPYNRNRLEDALELPRGWLLGEHPEVPKRRRT